jgi:hypothetical protein
MFQEDVSEVMNKVSNIFTMHRERAPTSNEFLTKKIQVYFSALDFVSMFTL